MIAAEGWPAKIPTFDSELDAYQRVSNPTWKEFREKFEDKVLDGKSQHTFKTATCVFNRIENIVRPERLRHVTSDRPGGFVKELRREKTSWYSGR
jgi:hypothetical protein